MRGSILILVLTLASGSNTCGLSESRVVTPVTGPAASRAGMNRSAAKASEATPGKIDFATQVKPILVARCGSCHFAGGVMYQRLPFDRPETIRTLGEKLFTRLKDENDRRTIREFLSQ